MSRFKVGDKVCYLGGRKEDDFKRLIILEPYTVKTIFNFGDINNRDIIYFEGIPDIGFFDGDYFAPDTPVETATKAPSLQWQQYSATNKYIIIEGLIWCYINQQLIDGATKFVATNGYTNEVICVGETIEEATVQADDYYSGLIGRVFAVDALRDFISQQKPVPPEFDMIFRKNMRNLLSVGNMSV